MGDLPCFRICKCKICKKSVLSDSFAALTCQHNFHFECIINFIECNKKCPDCEKPAFATDIIRSIIDCPQPSTSTSVSNSTSTEISDHDHLPSETLENINKKERLKNLIAVYIFNFYRQ